MAQVAWIDVMNLAIIKVGTQMITSPTQNTVPARLCNKYLPFTVGKLLRKYPWKSAMKTVALAALEAAPPDPAWGFAYPLPTDILRVWKYVPGSPLAGVNYGSNYVIRSGQIWSNDGINTSQNPSTGSPPVLTYVFNPYTVGPGELDFLLIEAIACQLAVDICYQITESLPLKQSLAADAKVALQSAKGVDSMETPEVYDFEASEFLTSRFAGTGYMGVNNPGFPTAQ